MPTLEEKNWRAEADARTLAEAHVIKQDDARLKAAQKAADRLAKEDQKTIDGYKLVAKAKK